MKVSKNKEIYLRRMKLMYDFSETLDLDSEDSTDAIKLNMNN